MLRSVHMKLVMIMVLLILSLMAVVGAFLINSVMAFYLEEFYTQMSQVFDQSQNPALSRTLQTENSGEENGAEAVLEIMQAYSGELAWTAGAEPCTSWTGRPAPIWPGPTRRRAGVWSTTPPI